MRHSGWGGHRTCCHTRARGRSTTAARGGGAVAGRPGHRGAGPRPRTSYFCPCTLRITVCGRGVLCESLNTWRTCGARAAAQTQAAVGAGCGWLALAAAARCGARVGPGARPLDERSWEGWKGGRCSAASRAGRGCPASRLSSCCPARRRGAAAARCRAGLERVQRLAWSGDADVAMSMSAEGRLRNLSRTQPPA
jgi:hypothetical protein